MPASTAGAAPMQAEADRAFAPAQRRLLALLFGAGIVNYLDRAALAIAIVPVGHSLGLDPAQMGFVLAAFPLAYALAQLPAGALVDRYGVHRLLAWSLVLWSSAQLAGAFSVGLAMLFVCRLLLAIGESAALPCAQRLTLDHFVAGQRGRATGVWNAVSSVAPALAPLLLTPMMLAFGWRTMFATLGAVGLAYAWLWWTRYRSVAVHAPAAAARTSSWSALLSSGTTWLLMGGYFGLVYMHWVWQTWLPGYLEIERGIGIAKTGVLAAIVFTFGVFGSLAAGSISDALIRGGRSAFEARKRPLIVTLAGTALFTALASRVASEWSALLCIGCALGLNSAAAALAISLSGEVAPPGRGASLLGIQTCAGFIGGALAPATTGLIVHAGLGFQTAFFVSAAIGLLAVLCFATIGRPVAR